jgi:hypothetical protein
MYDASSKGSVNFFNLAQEFLQKNKVKPKKAKK